LRCAIGIPLVWLFNVCGTADLVNAFIQGNMHGLSPGNLGAAFYIPTTIVSLLLVAHALMFAILLQRQTVTI
jgi:hypothetical protein